MKANLGFNTELKDFFSTESTKITKGQYRGTPAF